MREAHRRLLEPYAIILARLHERIINMSDTELAEMDAAVKSASSTNCWYAVYRVAQIMEPEIVGQKLLRAGQRKSTKSAAPAA